MCVQEPDNYNVHDVVVVQQYLDVNQIDPHFWKNVFYIHVYGRGSILRPKLTLAKQPRTRRF